MTKWTAGNRKFITSIIGVLVIYGVNILDAIEPMSDTKFTISVVAIAGLCGFKELAGAVGRFAFKHPPVGNSFAPGVDSGDIRQEGSDGRDSGRSST